MLVRVEWFIIAAIIVYQWCVIQVIEMTNIQTDKVSTFETQEKHSRIPSPQVTFLAAFTRLTITTWAGKECRIQLYKSIASSTIWDDSAKWENMEVSICHRNTCWQRQHLQKRGSVLLSFSQAIQMALQIFTKGHQKRAYLESLGGGPKPSKAISDVQPDI